MAREVRPGQDAVKEVFGLEQKVLVRSGKTWYCRVIESITVLRHDDGTLEPRFWFSDFGNLSGSDVIALEDIRGVEPERQR